MTLQQLEYIVALDRYRHFAKAADACNVTQSTLSIAIQKLEQELDIRIFDREAHPIKPTEIGEEIIVQARIVLFNSKIISEIASSRKVQASGTVRLGMIGSVSAYLLPKMHQFLSENYPKVKIRAEEVHSTALVDKLLLTEVDCGIMAANMVCNNLLEIPIYTEELMLFVSPQEDIYNENEISLSEISKEKLWRMHGPHGPGNGLFPSPGEDESEAKINMAGTIETVVRIVDLNGGYTIVPEPHIYLMRERFKKNIRRIKERPNRQISLYIRKDYVSERLLNIIVDAIKYALPENCICSPLLNKPIKL